MDLNYFNELFVFQKKSKIKAGDGSSSGLYPFYTSSNILSKRIDEFNFEKESLIFGTGGKASIHFCDEKFSVSTDCFVCQPKEINDVFTKFIYYYLSGHIHILESGFKGAGLKHISKEYIKNLKIPLPPLETQKKIAAILDEADKLRQLNKQLIKKYEALTQSLFLDMFGDPVTNPKGWEINTVEGVCKKIYGGGTPSKAKPEYYEGNIPWVTPKDMKSEYISDSIDHINQYGIDNSSVKLIPKNNVLMVIRSGILKHTLPVAINTKAVTVNQDMKAYIPDKSFTNAFFLKSFFQAISKYLLNKVRAVTADNIEFKQIKELSFICPSIDLQNQFAERVKEIEQQKEQAQQALQKSENLFNSLLQKAFKGELVT